jgi:hypothetical protein
MLNCWQEHGLAHQGIVSHGWPSSEMATMPASAISRLGQLLTFCPLAVRPDRQNKGFPWSSGMFRM